MKKVLFVLILVCNIFIAEAQTEAECFQLIKKLDVPSEVMVLPNDNPATFWWNLPKYNAEYQKFEAALKKVRAQQSLLLRRLKKI